MFNRKEKKSFLLTRMDFIDFWVVYNPLPVVKGAQKSVYWDTENHKQRERDNRNYQRLAFLTIFITGPAFSNKEQQKSKLRFVR